MAKRNHTSTTSSTKHVRIGTAYYSPVNTLLTTLPREVPYIRLRGIWLINAGFLPGDDVIIRVTSGGLVITRG